MPDSVIVTPYRTRSGLDNLPSQLHGRLGYLIGKVFARQFVGNHLQGNLYGFRVRKTQVKTVEEQENVGSTKRGAFVAVDKSMIHSKPIPIRGRNFSPGL